MDKFEMEQMHDEIDAMRAENERLRVERDHFREAWAAAQVRIDCGTDAVEAVHEERAAVVAWLRKSANDTMLDPMTDRQVYARTYSALHRHADMIERGEHRREEER